MRATQMLRNAFQHSDPTPGVPPEARLARRNAGEPSDRGSRREHRPKGLSAGAALRYLGVDLAWGEGSERKVANRSGVVALEANGTISDAGWRIGPDARVDWIQRHAGDDALLLVDAPLVIANATGPRLADRQTGQRYGRWWVSANSVNLNCPHQAGVHLRERLEALGWRYSDGREGPPCAGRVVSECYPYTAIVGVPELGYDDRRPAYKRASKGMPAAQAWPIRTAACDELIRRIARLADFDPPLDIAS